MYEIVKVVNGYKIQRRKGTQRYYEVYLNKEGKRTGKFVTFHSVKKATEFCENIKNK